MNGCCSFSEIGVDCFFTAGAGICDARRGFDAKVPLINAGSGLVPVMRDSDLDALGAGGAWDILLVREAAVPDMKPVGAPELKSDLGVRAVLDPVLGGGGPQAPG